jgi:hypothetical protein
MAIKLDDGYSNHPGAKSDCPLCNGGGLLDDGDNYGAVMVPCPCTGQCPKDVEKKVLNNYPRMADYLGRS